MSHPFHAGNAWERKIAEQGAEIAKLRAALEEIASHRVCYTYNPDMYVKYKTLKEIARKALANEEGK